MELRWIATFSIDAVMFVLLLVMLAIMPGPFTATLIVIDAFFIWLHWQRYEAEKTRPIQTAEEKLKEYTLFGRLEELTKLRDSGMIDDEEFEARRDKILSQN